jgi:hypothetical protein
MKPWEVMWLWFWLAVGNFLAQGIDGGEWMVAAERSFFQFAACLCVAFVMHSREARK